MPRLRDKEIAWVAVQYFYGRSQADIACELGLSAASVNVMVRKFCELWGRTSVEGIYEDARKVLVRQALDRYLVSAPDARPERPARANPDYFRQPVPYYEELYRAARLEHAWLMRAGGETYREIGDRLGVCHERSRQMIMKYGRRVQKAILHGKIAVWVEKQE